MTKLAANYLAFIKLASIRFWAKAPKCEIDPKRSIKQ
jgi:hypothetical protein